MYITSRKCKANVHHNNIHTCINIWEAADKRSVHVYRYSKTGNNDPFIKMDYQC